MPIELRRSSGQRTAATHVFREDIHGARPDSDWNAVALIDSMRAIQVIDCLKRDTLKARSGG